jgi:hypothetical protein
MPLYRIAPTYTEPLVTGKNTTASWYRWVQHTEKGVPPASETIITNVNSPYTYTAPAKGFLIVTAGTVSSIQFSRTANVFYPTGQTAGTFPLNFHDRLLIVWSVAPNLVWVPQ